MASILLISRRGLGVPLSLKLSREGHIVKVWIKEGGDQLKGYQNPSRIQNFRNLLEQYDLIIADGPGNGDILDELKDTGKLTLGGGTFNDRLEKDRAYSLKVVQSTLPELIVPHGVVCRDINTLQTALRSGEAIVVKSLNGNTPLVSRDKQNRTLSTCNIPLPCVAEEMIDGVEVTITGWFNGLEWVYPFGYSISYNRRLDGGKGPIIDCMGNVVWYTGESDRLVEVALIPLSDLLKKVQYNGPISTRCIIQEDRAYFINFTAGFNYDATQAFTELLRMSLFDYLYVVATQSGSVQYLKDQYSIAVRMMIEGDVDGMQVLDINDGAESHIWLNDVKKDDVPVLTGHHIGCVTARGLDIREARRRVYRTIKKCIIYDNVEHRTDIGQGVENKIFQLKDWKWIT